MTISNLVSYSAQVAVLIVACAALPRALRVRSPGLQYLFWRVLLVTCVFLPLVQPWHAVPVSLIPGLSDFSASAAVNGATGVTGNPGASFGPLAVTAAQVVLVSGIAARLVWLGVGVFRLRRLRARATGATNAFADLRETIGASAAILWSAEVRHPVTFGIWRPVVLLPGALASAAVCAQRAVAAHELHHVKRYDWAWVVGEEIVRSIFWFHPAVWWLISRVQLARETVVDELSILATNARREYLDTLLAFADDSGLASTPAFSARRHLFHRVMLLSKEENMSSPRIAFATCVLVAALGTGAWGAVRGFPLSMTVASDAHDENLPADQSTRPETRATGPLAPQPAPQSEVPESYLNTIERLHPLRLGGNVKPPAKLKDVKPVYPEDAMAAKIQGELILEVIVDDTGHVADARVVQGVPELNDAALKAVTQWEFTPTLLNGAPTAVILTCTMTFSLR
ncbi:MAG TPA: M56 family metallopeptidase [Vicinamibacterales bacterium]